MKMKINGHKIYFKLKKDSDGINVLVTDEEGARNYLCSFGRKGKVCRYRLGGNFSSTFDVNENGRIKHGNN